jgi:hypothetical protein
MRKISMFDKAVYDFINGIPIVEHAFSYRDVKEKIESKAFTLGEHLVKLMIYEHNPWYDHWVSEVFTRINEISKLKIKGSMRLKSDVLFDMLYTGPWEDNEQGLILTVNEILAGNVKLKDYIIVINMKQLQERLKLAISTIVKYFEGGMTLDELKAFMKTLNTYNKEK